MPVCIIRPLKISHILPTTPYTWNRHSINICQAGRPPCSSPSKTPKKPSALGGIPAKITTYYFQLPIISTSTFLSTADIFSSAFSLSAVPSKRRHRHLPAVIWKQRIRPLVFPLGTERLPMGASSLIRPHRLPA